MQSPARFNLVLFFALLLLTSINPLIAAEQTGKFFGAKDTEYPSWFKQSFLDIQEDVDEATENKKRLMIFFHQDGCPYCNALVDRNLSQKNIREYMQSKFDVVAINMWGDREITDYDGKAYTEKTFALAKNVQFTPTLLFYNERGEVILRLNGYRGPDRFLMDLEYVAGAMESKVNYRQYIKDNGKTKTAASKQINKLNGAIEAPVNLQKLKNKPMAVFFEQKDCPNCDYLHKKVLPEKDVQRLLKEFNLVQVDMWKKTGLTTPQGKQTTVRDWAKKLDIQFAPSIVVFNRNGDEVIRSEAWFKTFHTASILDYVLTEKYKTEPSFQRFLTERADHIREQGQDVDIWQNVGE